MNENLAGAEAVVTGAGRGLGRAIAIGLAREGARVWMCARTIEELERTASLIQDAGGTAKVIRVDLSDPDACQELVSTVIDEARSLHVLVNNAAVLKRTPVEDLPLRDWAQTLAVNLTAPFLLTRDFLPYMKKEGGSVINVSSRSGVLPFAEEAAYCSSKFGLEGFTKCLALELAGTGISVNTVTPGLRIKPTSVTEVQISEMPDEEKKEWSDPEEIVPGFVFLAKLRGDAGGLRFDALRLSNALRDEGPHRTLERIKELAE